MRFVVLLTLLLISIFELKGQPMTELEDSINLYIYQEPNKAIPLLKKILPIYKKEKKWDKYTMCLYNISYNYHLLSNLEETNEYLKLTANEANKYLLKGHEVYGYIWHLYGEIASKKRDWLNGLNFFKKSINIDKEQINTNQEHLSIKYLNIGVIYDEIGDYEQAIFYYNEALATMPSEELQYKNVPIILNNNLGFVFFNLKKYKLARQFYKKALNLLEEFDPNDYRYNADLHSVYNNISLNEQALGNYSQVYFFSEKRINLPNIDDEEKSYIYKHIGTTLFKEKKYAKALDTLKVALRLREENYPPKHGHISLVHQAIGNVYQAQKNYKEALESYQSAIIAVVYDFENKDISRNPTLDNIVHNLELLKSLSAKAKTLQLMKKHKEALVVYQLCSQLLNKMRASFLHNGSKLFFMEEGIPIYEAGIVSALAIGDKNAAFELAEKSKAMLLLEAMRGASARYDLPEELTKKENDLKIDIAFYERKIWEERQKDEQNEENIKKWESLIFDLKEEYTNLKEQLTNDYPEYYKLKHDSKVSSVKDVQRKLLNSKTAMISYFIGEKQVFVFTITKKGVEVATLDKTANLTDWVENMRLCLQRDSRITNLHEVYYQTAFQLYDLFLAPALKNLPKGVNRLIIIPDDQLNFIPFEALLTANPNLPSPRYEIGKVPYLIRDYQVSYGYSATLLQESLKRKKAENLKTFGGFVPSFGGGNSIRRGCDEAVLGNLPFGRENIASINDIMNGQLHFDDEATLDKFTTLAEEYKILHLCTHACAEMDFKDTRIYFSDKELLAFELYNLPLNAELAVLSACETGIGELKRGEGVMSLARAFMYSGCPSVVTSLWSVDDKSTSEIMRYFYQHLKDGKTQDEALHQAKLDYLDGKGIEASHPFYWSGFVHIGNTEPLFGNDKTNYWYWIGGGLILLVIGFYFLRKK